MHELALNESLQPLDDEAPQRTHLPAEIDDVASLLPAIRRRHADRITAEIVIPARDGSYADFPPGLDPRIATALRARGIERLYAHQRAAWDRVPDGRDIVVVTPTASGKTLCYNLPVL